MPAADPGTEQPLAPPAQHNAEYIGRGVLWVLTPLSVAGTVIVLFDPGSGWNGLRWAMLGVLALISLCLVLSLISQDRFWWAPRLIAGLISLACLGFVFRAWIFPSAGQGNLMGPLGIRATLVFLLWGVPSLSFLLWGHTRGKLARGDAQQVTWMDRGTAWLLTGLFYAALSVVSMYVLRLLLR